MTTFRAFDEWLKLDDPVPENEWTVVEVDIDGLTARFGAYVWSVPNQRKLMFATTPFGAGTVLVGIAVLDSVELVTSEFQIDSADIQLLTDCSSLCSGTLPDTLYDDLRAGNQIRFGGTIRRPPERLFATVSLEGVDDVLDEIE